MKKLIKSKTFIISLYAASIIFSWLLIYLNTKERGIYGDAHTYIAMSGETNLYSPLRTLGYPLFLKLIRNITPDQTNWLIIVRVIQLILHTITSFLTIGILKSLDKKDSQLSPWISFAAFSLIQLNPHLLSLTQEILSDSPSVFFLTLFFYCLTSNKKALWPGGGIALGIAALMRPFYLTYGIIIILLVFAYNIIFVFRKPLEIKQLYLLLVSITLPFIALISIQYGVIYKNEKTLSYTGQKARSYIPKQLELGLFVYKYETYIGEDHKPKVFYIDKPRLIRLYGYEDMERVKLGKIDSLKMLLWLLLHDPFGSLSVISVKTVGLFQNYEWSLYRQTLSHNPYEPVFIYGFVMFWIFIYLIDTFVLSPGSYIIHTRKYTLLFFAMLIHIFAYSIFTVPERRFVYPIYPILTLCGFYTFFILKQKKPIVISVLISIITFSLVFRILQISQI